jgi:hypothetical protein
VYDVRNAFQPLDLPETIAAVPMACLQVGKNIGHLLTGNIGPFLTCMITNRRQTEID